MKSTKLQECFDSFWECSSCEEQNWISSEEWDDNSDYDKNDDEYMIDTCRKCYEKMKVIYE